MDFDAQAFLDSCESELKTNPDNYEVKFALSQVCFVTGNILFEKVVDAQVMEEMDLPFEWFNRSISQNVPELYPDYIEANYRMALLRHLQGRQGEAVEYVKKAFILQDKLTADHPLGKFGIRFFQIRSGTITNIGHLVNEPEFFEKMGQLGLRPPWRGVLVAPSRQVVNRAALNYWRRYLLVISDERLAARFHLTAKHLEYNTFWLKLPDDRIMYFWSGLNAVQKIWERQGKAPLQRLLRKHKENGWKKLEWIGVPKGSWFVTLHVRDQRFGKLGKIVEHKQTSNRDAEIESYYPAINYIVSRGGWVIRMGDKSMKPLPKMKNVIDYPHSGVKCDWMDLFLVAESRFYLGTASGLNGVPVNFGVPSILTNVSPMDVWALCGQDIYLPKIMRDDLTGRALTIEEGLSPPFDHCFNTAVFQKRQVSVIDNTAEELVEVVAEMLDRLEGKNIYREEDDALQGEFWRIAQKFEPFGVSCRIGRDFIRRHRYLLESPRLEPTPVSKPY